jgi:hypothetical protein
MLTAARASGYKWAPLAVAVIAAATKLATVVLPPVAPQFVINPALAIVAEGAVVTAGVALFSFRRLPRLLPQALSLALGWRLLFIGLLVVLPIRAGLLMKGTAALVNFIVVESVVNAVVIGAVVYAGAEAGRLRDAFSRFATPVAAPVALALAVGLQMAAQVL